MARRGSGFSPRKERGKKRKGKHMRGGKMFWSGNLSLLSALSLSSSPHSLIHPFSHSAHEYTDGLNPAADRGKKGKEEKRDVCFELPF